MYPTQRFPCLCSLSLSSRADALDAAIRTAKGGDTAGEIRRLEDALKRLRSSFQEAKELAVGSQEAAAKCQVRSVVGRRTRAECPCELVLTPPSIT